MAEAVTNEVNGLLFECANVDELASVLKRFLDEPDLLSRLQEGIPSVKMIQEEVAQLESIYKDLIQQKIAIDHKEG